MFHILPLFLIIISLGLLVVLVARRYPELTLLDLDTISERKEKKVKKELLTRKASKRAKEQHARIQRGLAPVTGGWNRMQTSFRSYVKRLKDDVSPRRMRSTRPAPTPPVTTASATAEVPSQMTTIPKDDTIEAMLKKGARALEEQKFQEAESAFIRAIEHDQKDVRAYEGLADVYVEQQQYEEARETYLFAQKLDPSNVSFVLKLARLSEMMEQWQDAVAQYEAAVLLDDANASHFGKLAELYLKLDQPVAAYEAISQAVELLPRHLPYLDMLVEISIMVQDTDRAEEGIQSIRMIDPTYSRLDVFRDRLAEIKSS